MELLQDGNKLSQYGDNCLNPHKVCDFVQRFTAGISSVHNGNSLARLATIVMVIIKMNLIRELGSTTTNDVCAEFNMIPS